MTPPPARRPAWLPNVLLMLGSIVLTLGATELVLRTFLPVRGMIYTLDDRYLFRQIPGSRKMMSQDGTGWPKVLVKINAAGRRGDESNLPRARHRVVVYGDSFMAAEYTPLPETYAAQLEQRLNSRRDLTIVLNAGVTGYGVDQESLRIEDDLPTLKPDLVIVGVYTGNDFGDLLRDKLYRLDGDGRLEKNVPVIGDELRQDFQAAAGLSSVHLVRALQLAFAGAGSERARPTSSPSSPAVPVDSMAFKLANRQAEYNNYVVGRDSVVRNLLVDEYDADVSLEPNSPSARYRVLLMEQVLQRIDRVVRQGGSKLLLLIIPERCDVMDTCDVSAVRRQYPGHRPSGLSDALEQIARRLNIPYVNLFEPFHNGGPAGLYHQNNEHWNRPGQALAAELSADLILKPVTDH